MAVFSTEFAVSCEITRAQFAAQAIAWVKGMTGTSLFTQKNALSDFSDEATIVASSGEVLTLKECKVSDGFVIGARHEIPDAEGRIWRSEVTLTSRSPCAALRIRTQCIIASDGARAQVPKKPYFIKLAIDDGWPAIDAEFSLNQMATVLRDEQLTLAASIINGSISAQLPVVYISDPDNKSARFTTEEIDNLAFKLSGIAHVVVEPSRTFSRAVMALTEGRNPYGGSIGICLSNYGTVKRYYIGSLYKDSEELFQGIYSFVSQYVTNRKPRLGWDWQDLIEEAARQLRHEVQSGSADFNAWLELMDQEMREKDSQIQTLREQLDKLQQQNLESAKNDTHSLFGQISAQLGRELYKGEFFDRLRSIIAEFAGLPKGHSRTREIAQRILTNSAWSGGASRLISRLKEAGKDSANADERFASILMDIGYSYRKVGGHPVMSPDGLCGLSSQTLSSSPSDYRAGRNAAARIIRDLGIDSLHGGTTADQRAQQES